jgi:hypothetical protein
VLHHRDGVIIVIRRLQERTFLSLTAAALVAGCGNNAARAPHPTSYRWPEQFAYRLDYVSETQRGRQPILHYAETKTTRFAVRDAQFLAAQDSVLKTSQRPGEPLRLVSFAPEDTLAFYVSLGPRGEITRVQLACDPVLPGCVATLPSGVALELRRFIPRLPIWEAPRGSSWADTLEFDETARPGGMRVAMITRYTGRRDTLLSGARYWVLSWHSVRHAVRAGQAVTSGQPTQEDGVTFVDKTRLMPVFSQWAGVALAPPELRALGAMATGYRGRAYLAGTVFDSLYAHQLGPQPARGRP